MSQRDRSLQSGGLSITSTLNCTHITLRPPLSIQWIGPSPKIKGFLDEPSLNALSLLIIQHAKSHIYSNLDFRFFIHSRGDTFFARNGLGLASFPRPEWLGFES